MQKGADAQCRKGRMKNIDNDGEKEEDAYARVEETKCRVLSGSKKGGEGGLKREGRRRRKKKKEKKKKRKVML